MRKGINYLMLLKVIGWLVMIEAGFMLVPLFVSLWFSDGELLPFGASALFTLLVGLIMTFGIRPSNHRMAKREGYLLTALVWIVFSLFGMIPFMVCTTPVSFSDAFFEAMSGFTTTGVSVMEASEFISPSIHIWRVLMQWIGGMGIILFTLAVLPMLNSSGGMQMFNAEVTGITHEKLRPRVSSTAKRLWLVYFTLTAVLMGLYCVGPMSVFDSICHAMSTMSTGGFSTHSDAIESWNSNYIKIVTTLFMFIGGVNFALIFKASIGQFGAVWRDPTFRVFVKIILVLFVVFAVALILNPAVPERWESYTIDPLFQIVSAITSTGYVVKGLSEWGSFPLALILVMAFFGACAGSTSGGAKIDRALVFWKNSRNEIYRCIYPNHILPVQFNGRTMQPEIINKVMVFLGLYMLVIIGGAAALTLFGLDIFQAFVTALNCVSNSGMNIRATDFGELYVRVPEAGKWLMALLMLTGRLEVFTIVVLFTRGFWRK